MERRSCLTRTRLDGRFSFVVFRRGCGCQAVILSGGGAVAYGTSSLIGFGEKLLY